jgi:hypothetical protein
MESRITTPPTKPGVQIEASQGKVRRHSEGRQRGTHSSQICQQHRLPPDIEYAAAKQNNQSMAIEEAQPQGTGAREPECEQTEKNRYMPMLFMTKLMLLTRPRQKQTGQNSIG